MRSVLGQIQALDSSLSRAIEAYNLATERLRAIEGDLRTNARHLNLARKNFRRSQGVMADRLVALYTKADETPTLGLLLGATSLDEILTTVETVDRVSEQDIRVHRETASFRTAMRRARLRLRAARLRQKQVVRERDAHRASVRDQLAERRVLVASIRSEIERLREAERRRQAEFERQARARLVAQRAPALSPVVEAVTSPETVADSTQPEVAPTPAPAAQYGGVVGIAMRYLGTPYVWGGASPSGFDCSGFVMYVYSQVGVSLPHNAAAQYGYGTPVSQGQLQPGDLVFFNGLGHNGIYIGGGQFIHSPHTGDVVKISSMSGWYSSTYVGARRL